MNIYGILSLGTPFQILFFAGCGYQKKCADRFPIHKAPNSRCDALPFMFLKLSVLHHKVFTRLPSLVITYDAQWPVFIPAALCLPSASGTGLP